MRYLRDRYRNECGHERPEDFDNVGFYAEWLEMLIDKTETKPHSYGDTPNNICYIHTTEEVFAVSHTQKDIRDMFDNEKSYIMVDVYTRCISFNGNNNDNPTRPLCVPKSKILKW